MKKILLVLTCLMVLLVNSCALFICDDGDHDGRDNDSDTITIITHGILINDDLE